MLVGKEWNKVDCPEAGIEISVSFCERSDHDDRSVLAEKPALPNPRSTCLVEGLDMFEWIPWLDSMIFSSKYHSLIWNSLPSAMSTGRQVEIFQKEKILKRMIQDRRIKTKILIRLLRLFSSLGTTDRCRSNHLFCMQGPW